MGRPRAKEPRIQQLNLSFTASELESIRMRASALGMRPSYFGRDALLGMKCETSRSANEDRPARIFHQQLIRLGNNLNQMVRHLHQTGDPLPPDLEPLLKDIRDLISKLAP